MRVGILTYHRAYNYGAALQAFALRTIVSELGFECEIIDYGSVGQTTRFGLSFRGIKPFVASVLINLLSLINGDIRRYKFRRFRKDLIGVSEKRFPNMDALVNSINDYDVFITGSDQVWNPFLSGNDPSYLLAFVPDNKNKISYAASFGINKIPENLKEIYSRSINRLNHISVRESAGQKIILDLTSRKSEVILDPVFLIPRERWVEISSARKLKQSYILCFVIMDDPPGFKEFCGHIRKITGYRIIRIANPVIHIDLSERIVSTAGPLDFITLIREASLVVTNSFHGTAMSIILNVPFYTFLYNSYRDQRLVEIAQKFGLSDRLVTSPGNLPQPGNIKIDFTNSQKVLRSERDKAFGYLKSALSVDADIRS
jgi:hypothetical protein